MASDSSFMRTIRDPIFPLMIEQGELAVCLNNERNARVLSPGKYRRLWNLPLRGVKRIIRFSMHESPLRVDNISLIFRDPDNKLMTYPTQASAIAVIRVNADSELLQKAIARFDPDQMEDQIRRTVEDAVTVSIRQGLQRLTHEQVIGSPDLGPDLNMQPISALDGLLTIVRLERIDVQPNAELAAVERTRREALVKFVEAETEEALLDLQSSRQGKRTVSEKQEQLEGWVQIMQSTGLPLDVIANPEILTTNAQAAIEFRTKLIENPDSLRVLMKQPEILKALSGSQTQEPPWPAQDVSRAIEPSDDDLQLHYDTLIGRLLGSDGETLAICGSVLTQFSVRGSFAAEAVLVSAGPELVIPAISRIRSGLKDSTGASTVVVFVVPYEPDLKRFVESFYRSVAPPQAYGYRTLSVVQAERLGRRVSLKLRVDGAARSVGDIIRGENERRQDQLQSLLMADQISIETV